MSKTILNPLEVHDVLKIFKKSYPRQFEIMGGSIGTEDSKFCNIVAIDKKTKEHYIIVDRKYKPQNNIKKLKETLFENLEDFFDIPISSNSEKFVIAEMIIEYDDVTRQKTVSMKKLSEFVISDKEYADRLTNNFKNKIIAAKTAQKKLPLEIEDLKRHVIMLESEYNQIPSQIKQLNKVVDEINNADDVSEKIKIAKSHLEE